MLMAVGCQSSTEAPRPAKSSTAAQKADADAKPTLKEQREAFGIALPPDSYDINRAGYTIEATTKLNLSEVEAFYGGKLKEHERLSTRRMREWIPLFEYLPKVTAVQLSSRSPTQLTFELKAPKAEAAAVFGGPVEWAREGATTPP